MAADIVNKSVSDGLTNHNKILINSFSNVMKEVFYGAPVDLVGPAYYNLSCLSAPGTNMASTSQQLNGGQPPVQHLQGGQI
jgi:hypothetical protein